MVYSRSRGARRFSNLWSGELRPVVVPKVHSLACFAEEHAIWVMLEEPKSWPVVCTWLVVNFAPTHPRLVLQFHW